LNPCQRPWSIRAAIAHKRRLLDACHSPAKSGCHSPAKNRTEQYQMNRPPLCEFQTGVPGQLSLPRPGMSQSQELGSLAAISQCAVKGAGQQRVQFPPGSWFVPPGSNRSSGGGNEAAEASDIEGRVRRLGKHAGRNVSERRAGLEKGNAGADPPEIRGRPKTTERYERTGFVGPAGVVATACMQRGPDATREASAGIRS
jgi:hypothetical protein